MTTAMLPPPLSVYLSVSRPRVPAHRVQIIKFGIGGINQLDLAVASAGIDQKLPTAVYAFNLPAYATTRARTSQSSRRQTGLLLTRLSLALDRARADVRAEARRIGVPLRRYDLLHELLADLLERAGLPGPQRELARMADDAPEATGYSHAGRVTVDPRTAKGSSPPSADEA